MTPRQRLRRRYGLWLWFGFRRGQRPPPGPRWRCCRLRLWSGRRPWRWFRVRRSRPGLRVRHRRRLHWSGWPRGLTQARQAVLADRAFASGEPACEVGNECKGLRCHLALASRQCGMPRRDSGHLLAGLMLPSVTRQGPGWNWIVTASCPGALRWRCTLATAGWSPDGGESPQARHRAVAYLLAAAAGGRGSPLSADRAGAVRRAATSVSPRFSRGS